MSLSPIGEELRGSKSLDIGMRKILEPLSSTPVGDREVASVTSQEKFQF